MMLSVLQWDLYPPCRAAQFEAFRRKLEEVMVRTGVGE